MARLTEEYRELRLAVLSNPPNDFDTTRVLSGVLHLASYSQLHATYGLQRLYERVRPSLALGQFVFCIDRTGAPAAFCNWAWVSSDVLDDVVSTGRDLLATEFHCGAQPIFYEFLAPFGHCIATVRILRQLPQFRGLTIPALRTSNARGLSMTARKGKFYF